MKIIRWSKEKATEQAKGLIDYFKQHISTNERRWRENEQAYKDEFYKKWRGNIFSVSDIVAEHDTELSEWLVQASLNHIFTFVRLLHSMLISNEPTVTASPTQIDESSLHAANATDMLARFIKEEYDVHSKVDLQILHTLIYGLGTVRVDWDSAKGDIVSYSSKTDEIVLEGDLNFRVVDPYNYCIISNTNDINDSYRYIERHYLDKEEAEAMYPKQQFDVEENIHSYDIINGKSNKLKDKVAIFEYFEKKRAINGMQGRYFKCKSDGTILDLGDNPLVDKGLPVSFFADIILPGSIQPLSIVDMLRKPNKLLNDLFSKIMENVKLFTRVWLLADREAGLDDDLSDKPYEVISHNGKSNNPLTPMAPPQISNFVFQAHNMIVEMMQHIAGLRDFSRGMMQKNVSGFAASLMTEADNKVHIQVHERYKNSVKRIFQLAINYLQVNWDEKKVINVIGKENEVDSYEFKKADFAGGYKLKVDYGTSVPIDPAAKRQMIQELLPFIQQLGIQADGTKLLEFMKLGDLVSTFDAGKSSRKRQKKEIKMIEEAGEPKGIDYYAEDHMAHYTELFLYFQNEEYDSQPDEIKVILKQHAKDHMEAAQLIKQGVTEEQYQQMKESGMPVEQMLAQQQQAAPAEATPQEEQIDPSLMDG